MAFRPLPAAAVLFVGGLAAAVAADPPAVTYRDERLTVRADKVGLARLVEEIGRATGAIVRGTPPDREVTLQLDAVAVGEALERLLGSDSFALRYGADGRLRTIDLLAAAAWPPLVPEPPAAGAAVTASEEQRREVMSRPLPVSGSLETALGTSRPAAGQVIQAALQQVSPTVRTEAQDRVIAAFRTDPELEATFLATLTPIEDANLARMLRNMGGDRAEDFFAKLAAEAPSPALRTRAAAALQALRAADEPAARP